MSPRFATVCVRGKPLRDARNNGARLKLMKAVVERIAARDDWANLDAVVLPGGFARASKPIGQYSFEDRRRALDKMGLETPFVQAARGLSHSPRVHVVFGIDGPKYDNGDGGDQLCIGATPSGITSIARKVFPTAFEADNLLCFSSDFLSTNRNVSLASGHSAALCACYDMFGVAERDERGTRARYIRWIGDLDGPLGRGVTVGYRDHLNEHLDAFAKGIENAACTVGISAIHYFQAHSTGFWQRHGLAACSASLSRGRGNPGYAIGAAHFADLPKYPHASTLAAANVPLTHLNQGHGRKAHSWPPSDHFYFEDQALVRLFS